jgi:TolA-binding protein
MTPETMQRPPIAFGGGETNSVPSATAGRPQELRRARLRGRALRAVAVFVLVWLGLTGGAGAVAPSAAEKRAFEDAVRPFQDKFWEKAERQFDTFTKTYPESEYFAEALLLQAQSRYWLKRYEDALSLLAANRARAGNQAGEYQYWIGEIHFKREDFKAAAETFAQFIKEFPKSTHLFEAGYNEAFARFKLGEPERTIQLLREPAGVFAEAAQGHPDDPWVIRGYLLLAEALLQQKEHKSAEDVLNRMADGKLSPEQKWQRHYLLERGHLADQRAGEALQNVTNLFALIAGANPELLRARTVALHGAIWQQLNGIPEAIQVYTNNLSAAAPPEYRREALLKIVEMNLAQNQFQPATERLETFIAGQPKDPILDLVRLTLGELRLKEYYNAVEKRTATNAPDASLTATNLLQQARMQFERLTNDFPLSPLLGKAQLNRGWCLWEEGKTAESAASFQAAAEKLPRSEEQAVARFKLADAQFQQTNFAAAVQNYQLVLDHFGDLPEIKSKLFELALYQITDASVRVGDQDRARRAMEQILKEYPNSILGGQTALLLGHAIKRQGNPGAAREHFERFAQWYPDSPLLPEVELAVARLYVQETNWLAAMARYNQWVPRFTNHPALPQAEFDRAWVYDQAGDETNSFRLLTNFVVRFPKDPLASQAKYLIADSFMNAGDFKSAEEHFQQLYQSWPEAELAHQARLMAGRAAVARQGYGEARRDYFVWLINNAPPVRPSLAAQAYFAVGDTYIAEPATDQTNLLAKYALAINAFEGLIKTYTNSPLVPLAKGKIASCYLAVQDTARYEDAAVLYREIMVATNVELQARSEAEVGLGLVLEKQAEKKSGAERKALLDDALQHCLNVFYGLNRRGNEPPDNFWVSKAGLEAARLAESDALQMWSQAAKLYARLIDTFPPLRGLLEKRLENATRKIRSE